jgi:phage/plasmid-like protein (TIGR03299 family)
MTMIDMAGKDFAEAKNGIYLWRRDASRGQVGSGGGGTLQDLKGHKIRGWNTGHVVPGDTKTWADVAECTSLDFPVMQFDAAALIPKPDGGFYANRCPRSIANVRMESWQGIEDFDGKLEIVPGATATPKTVLGFVGKNWRGPQNRDAFTMIDTLVDDDSAKWLGAGEIDGGRRIYGLAQVAREIIVGGDDDERCLPLLFLSNGWDGGQGFRITVAPFRLACTNGMTIPLEGCARTFTARHTSRIVERIAEARRVLELTIGYLDVFEEVAGQLITQKVSKVAFGDFMERLVPMPAADVQQAAKDGGARLRANVQELREAIAHVHDTEEDLGNIRGTKWGALNAVAAHQQWIATPQVKNEERKAQLQLTRAFGANDLLDRAYALLTD